jgi:hypothetical protein
MRGDCRRFGSPTRITLTIWRPRGSSRIAAPRSSKRRRAARDQGAGRAADIVRHHRSHDVKNLFLCDGSSLVTSGRGQPTMTIQALAFRAGEHIARFATRGEI